MSVESHLDQLRQKHECLESQIKEQERQPSADHLEITALKREKLHVKEEIARLERTAS